MNSGLQITILNLVKKLQQRDEENFKSLGKSFGMEIQKGILIFMKIKCIQLIC